jgi:hypothetical protein
MARKATDLLDVFRYGGGDDDDDRAGGKPARRARTPRRRKRSGASRREPAPRERPGFQGLILSRRQLVLAGSAMLLLLVLTFVVGVSAGRPSRTQGGRALNRTALRDMLMVRGTMPALDRATRKEVDLREVRRILEERHHVPPANLRIHVEHGLVRIDIGPFRSERRAREYVERTQLDTAHLFGADPFLRPQILPFR